MNDLQNPRQCFFDRGCRISTSTLPPLSSINYKGRIAAAHRRICPTGSFNSILPLRRLCGPQAGLCSARCVWCSRPGPVRVQDEGRTRGADACRAPAGSRGAAGGVLFLSVPGAVPAGAHLTTTHPPEGAGGADRVCPCQVGRAALPRNEEQSVQSEWRRSTRPIPADPGTHPRPCKGACTPRRTPRGTPHGTAHGMAERERENAGAEASCTVWLIQWTPWWSCGRGGCIKIAQRRASRPQWPQRAVSV